ncbi:hypothetical protein D3OALGB2SA_2524 [Olavius algarvensis associated proteobacterium Delta 3]|nr:hypothetical protein D3OALGB2SA_2524 [Olavius algarvensis associated proteobacterium Delta 3]
MNANEIAVFNGANTAAPVTPASIFTFIASLIMVLALTWAAWVTISAYRTVAGGKSSSMMAWSLAKTVRAVLVVLIVGAFVMSW